MKETENLLATKPMLVAGVGAAVNKIIFLDIDGVLNPTHYMNALYKMWKASFEDVKSHDEYGQLFFYHNCNALDTIIGNTGAKIVMSSSWRMEGMTKMQKMWKDRRLAGEIIDVTPTANVLVDAGKEKFYDSVCRGAEIQYWIDANNFKGKYCIIDDDDDMLEEQQNNFVKTNSSCGLTYKDAEKAILILNA